VGTTGRRIRNKQQKKGKKGRKRGGGGGGNGVGKKGGKCQEKPQKGPKPREVEEYIYLGTRKRAPAAAKRWEKKEETVRSQKKKGEVKRSGHVAGTGRQG